MASEQITERAARRSRISMTKERMRRAISGEIDPREDLSAEERAEYRKVREEIQADTDMDMDLHYAPLLEALIRRSRLPRRGPSSAWSKRACSRRRPRSAAAHSRATPTSRATSLPRPTAASSCRNDQRCSRPRPRSRSTGLRRRRRPT